MPNGIIPPQVDPIGPLATLKNLFLSDKSLSVVKEFMDRYWYMIVLCLIIVILSLVSGTGLLPAIEQRCHIAQPKSLFIL